MLRIPYSLVGLLLSVLLISLAGCDYVGDENIYGLTDPDFTLLEGSDALLSYQFDFVATIELALGNEQVTNHFTGTGAVVVDETKLLPNLSVTVNASASNGLRNVDYTMEVLLIEDQFYQRVIVPGMEENAGWQVSSLEDMMLSNGIALPGLGSGLSPQMLVQADATGQSGIWDFSQISRLADGSVRSEPAALFDIQADMISYMASPAMLPLLEYSMGLNGADLSTLPEDQRQSILEDALRVTFPEFTIHVQQYVNLATGYQSRSVTNMQLRMAATDASLFGVTGEVPAGQNLGETIMTISVDTTYRDFDQPITITVPEDVPQALVSVEPTSVAPSILPEPEAMVSIPAAENLATFNPPSIQGQNMCSADCISQTVEIVLPPIGEQRTQFDLVVLLDVTSSMGEELGSVQTSIADVMTELATQLPDLRFAFATFSDHPEFDNTPGGVPYRLVVPFSTDPANLQAALANVGLTHGGNFSESSLYALDQLGSLDWRDNAYRIVVLITDDLPHDPDPGTDQQLNTSDDISSRDVISSFQNQGISVIALQGNADINNDSQVSDFLQRLTTETQGLYFRLNSAEEIPNALIELVGLILKGKLMLTPQAANFRIGSNPDWLTVSPSEFDYPEDGQPVSVAVEICPPSTTLPRGDYQFQLWLHDEKISYGAVNVTFDYAPLCADVYIEDTPEDTGSQCSDVGGQPFWDSSAIVVRRAPDGGKISDFPLVGQPNYVYVEVNNKGPLAADSVTVTLYSSPTPFNDSFPAYWQQIGQQTIALGAGETRWLEPPFEWIPTTEFIALYASVTTPEDVILKADDVACDNNVAVQSRIPLVLDNPSFGPNLMAGLLPLSIGSDLTYNLLDLNVSLSPLDTRAYVALDLDRQTLSNWIDRDARLRGGSVLASGRVVSIPGTPFLQLEELIGGPTAAADFNLMVVAPIDSLGSVPIGLDALDRTVTGSSVYYRVDEDVMPRFGTPEAASPIEEIQALILPNVIPLAMALGLLMLWLILKFVKRG